MPLHVKLHLKTGIHRSTRQGGRQTESLTFVFRAPGIKSKRTPSDKNQALNLDGVDLTAAADTLLLPSRSSPAAGALPGSPAWPPGPLRSGGHAPPDARHEATAARAPSRPCLQSRRARRRGRTARGGATKRPPAAVLGRGGAHREEEAGRTGEEEKRHRPSPPSSSPPGRRLSERSWPPTFRSRPIRERSGRRKGGG